MRYVIGVCIVFGWLTAKVVPQGLPRLDIDYTTSQARYLLNQRREAVGLGVFSSHKQLSDAARRHARYIVVNDRPAHEEDRLKPLYFGHKPADRAVAAGYASRYVIENLTSNSDDAKQAVEHLFSAIYHRFAFLDPTFDQVGVGVAQNDAGSVRNAFVFMLGNSTVETLCQGPSFDGYGRYVYEVCADRKKRIAKQTFNKAKGDLARLSTAIIVYPYDGQESVDPAFYDEIPDPLPDMDVSGFPVSIAFNPYRISGVTLDTFVLYDESGKRVPTRFIDQANDPHRRFESWQYALFPLRRLEYDRTYKAVVMYRHDGKRKRYAWSFHTFTPPEPLFRIMKDEASVRLNGQRSVWLYLVPRDAHDKLGVLRYPETLHIRFIDDNTLRVVVPEHPEEEYVIHVSGRRVTLVP